MNVATTRALELLIPASWGRSDANAMSAPRVTRSKLVDSRLTTVATYCDHDAFSAATGDTRLVSNTAFWSIEITRTRESRLGATTTQNPRSSAQTRLRPPA